LDGHAAALLQPHSVPTLLDMTRKQTDSNRRNPMRVRNFLIGAVAMASLAISVAPAHADWRGDHWRHEQWRREHWRHEEWRREHWRPQGYYYNPPPVYYAPPQAYYAPPPVYYSPGVTFGFNFR
jgi:hypothetical protein